MSVSDILKELPRLTHRERRELARKIHELEPEQSEIDVCDHLAAQGARLLDAIEEEDARSQQR